MFYKTPTLFYIGFLFSLFIFSCSNNNEEKNELTDNAASKTENETVSPPSFNTNDIGCKTFEVKDTTSGKRLGWGYDIIVEGHTTIHQPIIPGVAGNKSFPTEEQAKKTGDYAVHKMKQNGGLPTITIIELDSLGITKY